MVYDSWVLGNSKYLENYFSREPSHDDFSQPTGPAQQLWYHKSHLRAVCFQVGVCGSFPPTSANPFEARGNFEFDRVFLSWISNLSGTIHEGRSSGNLKFSSINMHSVRLTWIDKSAQHYL
jgi:hypothetical protein